MNKIYKCIFLCVFSIACGVMTVPVAIVNTPDIVATQEYVIHTQEIPSATETPYPATTATRRPLIILGGCWNIRSGAGLSYPVVSVQCGGELTPLKWAQNGFVQVDGGYICNRAFGTSVECK